MRHVQQAIDLPPGEDGGEFRRVALQVQGELVKYSAKNCSTGMGASNWASVIVMGRI